MSTGEAALSEQVGDYLRHLQIERGLASNTVASYRRDLVRYAEFLEAKKLADPADITEKDVARFLAETVKGTDEIPGLSARSAGRVLAAVRGLHKYWALERVTAHDPAARVTPPKAGDSLPKALTVEEVLALLEAPSRSTALGLRDRALLELLYATGARVSEAVGLDVDDLHRLAQKAAHAAPSGTDGAAPSPEGAAASPGNAAGEAATATDDGLLVVRVTGKGAKQRLVPMGRYAQQAVADYLTAGRPALAESAAAAKRAASPALFLNQRGGRLSRQSAWTILQNHAAAAGIAHEVSPHTLRHSCATHMLEGGAGIRTVQEMLGHASVTTTQIYTRVTAEALAESYIAAHPRALGPS